MRTNNQNKSSETKCQFLLSIYMEVNLSFSQEDYRFALKTKFQKYQFESQSENKVVDSNK